MVPDRIFLGPDHFEDSDAAWDDTRSRDFHVVVFNDDKDLLFVPQYNNVNILRDAFADALLYANKQVKEGKWAEYKMEYHYDPYMAWPCVRLHSIIYINS